MAATPYHVAEAFMRGKPATSGSFVSVGDALYSYALKLAHWTDDGLVRDVDPEAKAQSVTTARHIRAARAILPPPSECRAMRDGIA